MPMDIIKPLSPMILLIAYKNGMIKILNDTKEQHIPFFPYFISGTNINHARRLELIGYSDQVNIPDIAMSQIEHTITTSNNNTENDIVKIFWKDAIFFLADFSA